MAHPCLDLAPSLQAPNTVIVITPNIFKNDVVKEALGPSDLAAVGGAAVAVKEPELSYHHLVSVPIVWCATEKCSYVVCKYKPSLFGM